VGGIVSTEFSSGPTPALPYLTWFRRSGRFGRSFSSCRRSLAFCRLGRSLPLSPRSRDSVPSYSRSSCLVLMYFQEPLLLPLPLETELSTFLPALREWIPHFLPTLRKCSLDSPFLFSLRTVLPVQPVRRLSLSVSPSAWVSRPVLVGGVLKDGNRVRGHREGHPPVGEESK
jgi:hypothetical protein